MPRKKLKSLLKENKGFTVTELLVTCVVFALVAGMIAQVSFSFFRQYQKTEDRWKLQNETKIVMQQLENSQTGIKSSATADMFYYSDVKASIPGLSEITESDIKAGYFVTEVNISQSQFTYFFTLPAQEDENGVYIWKGSAVKEANVNPDGDDEDEVAFVFKKVSSIPMDIEFSIPSRPTARKIDPATNKYVDDVTNEINNIYLTKCTHVLIKGSGRFESVYELEETIALDNLFQNQDVNIKNGLPTDKAHVAGWTNEIANANPAQYMKIPIVFEECPNATKTANVIRYISVSEYYSSGEGGNIGDMNVGTATGIGICSSANVMAGSSVENFVLGSMRDFRDNVLAKSEIGTEVISYYYNSWSPAWNNAISENGNLSQVYKVIIFPVAVVANILS